MSYVVRSMSTTDYGKKPVVPFHVFLLPPHKRSLACWTTYPGHAQLFDTPQEAETEMARALHDHATVQIAPLYDEHFPTFWDLQDMNRAHRASKGAAA
jgi:hypothetical protein